MYYPVSRVPLVMTECRVGSVQSGCLWGGGEGTYLGQTPHVVRHLGSSAPDCALKKKSKSARSFSLKI